MEFIKAGDGLWVSRNNAYVIIKDGPGAYRLLDGYSRPLGTATSLAEAEALVRAADRMDDFQWIKVAPLDSDEDTAQAEAEDGDWRKSDDPDYRDSMAEDGDF